MKIKIKVTYFMPFSSKYIYESFPNTNRVVGDRKSSFFYRTFKSNNSNARAIVDQDWSDAKNQYSNQYKTNLFRKTNDHETFIDTQDNNEMKENKEYHHIYTIVIEYHLITDYSMLNPIFITERN